MFEEYMNMICNILQIEKPIVKVDKSVFANSTAMAYFDYKNNTLFVPKPIVPSFDTFFAIAHELRHSWQVKTNFNYYFSDYKTRNEVSNKEYNLQPAEIDANAFAKLVVFATFEAEPLFKGLDDDVKNKIQKRYEELISEHASHFLHLL